jgi:hypothetical protein
MLMIQQLVIQTAILKFSRRKCLSPVVTQKTGWLLANKLHNKNKTVKMLFTTKILILSKFPIIMRNLEKCPECL